MEAEWQTGQEALPSPEFLSGWEEFPSPPLDSPAHIPPAFPSPPAAWPPAPRGQYFPSPGPKIQSLRSAPAPRNPGREAPLSPGPPPAPEPPCPEALPAASQRRLCQPGRGPPAWDPVPPDASGKQGTPAGPPSWRAPLPPQTWDDLYQNAVPCREEW